MDTTGYVRLARRPEGARPRDRLKKLTSTVCRALRVANAIACLALIACGGSKSDGSISGLPSTPSQPTKPVPTSLDVGAPKQNLFIGDTTRFTATVQDASLKAMPGETVSWSSENTGIAAVTSAGLVTALAPGSTNIVVTVNSRPSLSARTIVNVASAPVVHVRPAGSILSIGVDSIRQFGEWSRITTLDVIDTAKSGSDYRVARLHGEGGPPSDASRFDYPLVRVLAECPNGEAYGIEDASDSYGTRLWRIASTTGVVSLVGTVSLGPGLVAGVTCDPTNTLYVAMDFGGIAAAYRLTRTGVSTPIQTTGQVIGGYRGIASSPTGVIYATVIDQLSVLNPPFPQYLITLNTATGSPASSVRSPTGGFIQGPVLVFRGARLFGVTGTSIYEINVQTGATSTIRNVQIP